MYVYTDFKNIKTPKDNDKFRYRNIQLKPEKTTKTNWYDTYVDMPKRNARNTEIDQNTGLTSFRKCLVDKK